MSLGLRMMSLPVALEKELRDEFGDHFNGVDEFGARFLVCLRETGLSLMSLGVRLMSLPVGLEKELRAEFGDDFDEFDEFGGHFLVWLRQKI